ncbi:hypothetical protein PS15p_205842 [Mucor circinelloides]
MDDLTPQFTETKKGKRMLTSRICRPAWDKCEVLSEKQVQQSPFEGAGLPLCQDSLWKDYGQKQESQSLPSSKSSQSSSSVASNTWHRFVDDFSVLKDGSSFDSSGDPWASQAYHRIGSWAVRKMNPINGFWFNYEANCAALDRMRTETKLEPSTPEDDASESYWNIFKTSTSSSPKTPTASTALSSIQEQVEEADDINVYRSDDKLVAPCVVLSSSLSSSNEDQLSGQGYTNNPNVDEMLDSTEELMGPEITYENEKAAEIIQEVEVAQEKEIAQDIEIATQEYAHTVDLLNRVDEQDVTPSTQDHEVNVMKESEDRIIRKEQCNIQSAPLEGPIEIVVKLSDIIQASYQPKLKLSDSIGQPSRPKVTLADLM